jgi:hypothetical protein
VLGELANLRGGRESLFILSLTHLCLGSLSYTPNKYRKKGERKDGRREWKKANNKERKQWTIGWWSKINFCFRVWHSPTWRQMTNKKLRNHINSFSDDTSTVVTLLYWKTGSRFLSIRWAEWFLWRYIRQVPGPHVNTNTSTALFDRLLRFVIRMLHFYIHSSALFSTLILYSFPRLRKQVSGSQITIKHSKGKRVP